ncbi:ABC transporter permease [Rhodococcus sp. NPDC058521]|uniref:ABC transporter permease n=1 Tax=Rhodococcus sp. NPDC058521 TaxID=3346536 RepID=UPI003647F447
MMGAALSWMRVFTLRAFAVHPARTATSITVVAVSAVLLVAVFGISGSITGSADRLTRSVAGNADLEVSGITDSGFDQKLQARVAAVPGVQTAVPMLRMSSGPPSERVLLLGADARIAGLHSELQRTVQPHLGRLLANPGGVAVGAGMGLSEGDAAPVGSGTAPVAVVLHGSDAMRVNGGRFVMAPLPLLQELTGRGEQLDSIMVDVAPDADASQVRAAVADTVEGRATVAEPSARSANAAGSVSVLRSLTLSSASAALVVAAFLVYNVMSMAISGRRPELSMLRAIGGSRRAMVGDLLAEAALVGAIGGIVGSVIGVFVGRQAIDALPTAIVQSVEARTEYMLPGYAVPVTVAACVLASVAAAAFAARQIYSVAPVEALAPVGASSADAVRRSVRVVAGTIGVGFLAAAVTVAVADVGRLSVGAIGLISAAEIALCFAFSTVIVRGSASIARVFGAPGALAAATVERAPRRVWATLMTVMIGVSVTMSSTGSNSNVVDSTADSFSTLANVDLFVSSTDPGVFPTAPLLPAGLRQEVEAIPGVEEVVQGQMAYASLGGARVMISGMAPGSGVPPTSAMDEQVRERVWAGDGVVISRDIGRSLGVVAGDTLDIPTPRGVHTVEVLQVVPFFSALGGVVAMNIEHMQEWFERPGETILGIGAAPGADLHDVETALREKVPDEIYVYTGGEGLTAITRSIEGATVLIGIMAWIVVVVASVALLNTLMLSVLERRRELGVLRAIGSSRRFALRTVLAEAAAIGLVGGAIGVAFGAANQYLNSMAMSNVLSIDVEYQPMVTALLFAAVAVVLSLLGSIPPALRAARLNIVAAVGVE